MQLLNKLFGRKAQFDDTAAMPIPAERLQTLKAEDQFLVSYPRSGNTWTRYLIHDLLVQCRPDLPVPEQRGVLVPDIHRHDISAAVLSPYNLKGRILKSHNLRDLRGRRFVYLIRDPSDTLVSYYHFHLRYDRLRPLAQDGPDAFCRMMLPDWVAHVRLALDFQAASPNSAIFVQYEALLADGIQSLQRIANFFGIPATPEALRAAIENNAFNRLRTEEEKKPLNPAANPKEFFFRKGQSGSGTQELSPETVKLIHEQATQLTEEIGKVTASPAPEHVK